MSSFHYKIHDYSKRSMAVFKYLDFIWSHTHSCLSEDGSSGTHLFVKNILKNIYHV